LEKNSSSSLSFLLLPVGATGGCFGLSMFGFEPVSGTSRLLARETSLPDLLSVLFWLALLPTSSCKIRFALFGCSPPTAGLPTLFSLIFMRCGAGFFSSSQGSRSSFSPKVPNGDCAPLLLS
jgi:hypothetical protein